MNIDVYIHIYMYICIYMNIYVYIYIYMYIYVYIRVLCLSVFLQIGDELGDIKFHFKEYRRVYVSQCIYVCLRLWMCVFLRVCVYVCVCVCVSVGESADRSGIGGIFDIRLNFKKYKHLLHVDKPLVKSLKSQLYSSTNILHSTFGSELIESSPAILVWYNFSNISSIFLGYGKSSSELTFDIFLPAARCATQYPVIWVTTISSFST